MVSNWSDKTRNQWMLQLTDMARYRNSFPGASMRISCQDPAGAYIHYFPCCCYKTPDKRNIRKSLCWLVVEDIFHHGWESRVRQLVTLHLHLGIQETDGGAWLTFVVHEWSYSHFHCVFLLWLIQSRNLFTDLPRDLTPG